MQQPGNRFENLTGVKRRKWLKLNSENLHLLLNLKFIYLFIFFKKPKNV